MTVYFNYVDHFECIRMKKGVWENKYFDHFEKQNGQNSQNECKTIIPPLIFFSNIKQKKIRYGKFFCTKLKHKEYKIVLEHCKIISIESYICFSMHINKLSFIHQLQHSKKKNNMSTLTVVTDSSGAMQGFFSTFYMTYCY